MKLLFPEAVVGRTNVSHFCCESVWEEITWCVVGILMDQRGTSVFE
jgi:hypothetical protein